MEKHDGNLNWISVEERLPENDVLILAFRGLYVHGKEGMATSVIVDRYSSEQKIFMHDSFMPNYPVLFWAYLNFPVEKRKNISTNVEFSCSESCEFSFISKKHKHFRQHNESNSKSDPAPFCKNCFISPIVVRIPVRSFGSNDMKLLELYYCDEHFGSPHKVLINFHLSDISREEFEKSFLTDKIK